MLYSVVLLFLTIIIGVVSTVKILCVFPIPSISHQVVFRVITEELSRRGHDLIVLTTDPNLDFNSDNYTEISIHDESYGFWRKTFLTQVKVTRNVEFYSIYQDAIGKAFESQIQISEFKKLLDDDTLKFDLLIVEGMSRLFFGLSHKLKVPIVSITSIITMLSQWEALGNPTNPLLYPDLNCVHNNEDLSILQKLDVIYDYLYIKLTDFIKRDSENKLLQSWIGDGVPSIEQLERETDLYLTSATTIFSGIKPLVPQIISQLNFLHVWEAQVLPQDLEDYIKESKNGVIYVSFGTNVRTVDLKNFEVILETLKQLPYNVLLKNDDEDVSDLPINIKSQKWFPQASILSHGNVKLFISQCGLQSLEESIINHVPIICMPYWADQFINTQRAIKFKIGIGFMLETLTVHQLSSAIKTVISDHRYKQNVKKLSDLLIDQPMRSKETAIWWIEYVLRHKGAKHLEAPMKRINYYDYFMLDVLGTLLFIIILTFYAGYLLVMKTVKQLIIKT